MKSGMKMRAAILSLLPATGTQAFSISRTRCGRSITMRKDVSFVGAANGSTGPFREDFFREDFTAGSTVVLEPFGNQCADSC